MTHYEAVSDKIISVGMVGSSVHGHNSVIRNGPSIAPYWGAAAPEKGRRRAGVTHQWAAVSLRNGAQGQSLPQQDEDVTMASSREEKLFQGFWCRAQVPGAPALTPALLDE